MLPAFRPGDHVLTFNLLKPKTGDVIVYHKDAGYYIKRVFKISSGRIFAEGDNKISGKRVPSFGFRDVVGVVLWKY